MLSKAFVLGGPASSFGVNLYRLRTAYTAPRMIPIRDPESFQKSVLQSNEPTVVMFWATWCPFCRRFKAEFEKVASGQPWRFAAVYLDDEDNPLWEDYAVAVVPTLALFRDGRVVDRLDGVLGYGIDRSMVDAFLRRVQPAFA